MNHDRDAWLTAIDGVHVEASGAMASLWGLDPEIVEIISMHHDSGRQGKPCPPLVHVLCVAEQLAEEAAFAIEPADSERHLHLDENLVGRFEHSVAALHLHDKLAHLRKQAAELTSNLELTSD